jgi:hypothetical protein
VAPENDNLRSLIQRSELGRHRIIESTINHHHLGFYQEIHGFELVHNKPRIVMPYDKHELRRIRQRLNQPAAPSAVQRLEPSQPALPDPFDE